VIENFIVTKSGKKNLEGLKRKIGILLFFWSGSLVARIHLIRWISGVSGVRTPTSAYNNALSYQLSYAHGMKSWYIYMNQKHI